MEKVLASTNFKYHHKCVLYFIQMSQRPTSSISRGESVLMNKSRRALDDGKHKSPIDKMRLLCLARGASGIFGLGR